MTKRIRLATARRDAAAWPHAFAAVMDAPDGVRPARLAVCTALSDLTDPGCGHDVIGIEWFTGTDHLRRYEEWLASSRGRNEHESDQVIIAEESVMRGGDWLERRWRDGGARYKHMALAQRADGLTPAEFSARWRDHAGRVRRAGASSATAIPEDVRGRAYVQNHPLPRTTGEWAYDALNEVYFDDPGELRKRIDWFRENPPGQGDGELFGRTWFIAVREAVVPA